MVTHFLHIPKTGGTAITEAFRRGALDLDDRFQLHEHHFRLSHLRDPDTAFFFLRNPRTRFVSAFVSRRRMGLPRYFFEWTTEEQKAFETFRTPNELATALYSPVLETRTAAETAMRGIRHVKTPYGHWLGSPEDLTRRIDSIRFIGLLESLDKDFARLRDLLHLPTSVSLPLDPVAAHRNPYAPADLDLSPEAIDAIDNWFEDDWKLYLLAKDIRADQGWDRDS